LELAFETHYRVEFEQCECDTCIIEIHPAGAQVTLQRIWQRIHVHFQADPQSRLWTDTTTDAAKTGSLDRAMQLQRATPEGFVAERVESEYEPSSCQPIAIVLVFLPIGVFLREGHEGNCDQQ
jgi:hypothetical protein